MDFEHFAEWIDNTSRTLRREQEKNAKITIIIDHATWHNRLTPESQPPKRLWRKSQLLDWLTTRNIKYETSMTKAELMEVAFKNLPCRQYAMDNLAGKHYVEILRIPKKHCVLNPIELALAGLKKYVRNLNVNFNLGDIA
ncbi:unnamed protein product [Rotaria magnacalcarata]|uniref:Uncharacterized protein n=1 Tax=Rotaria magnacalcarata TaxID=392030 RepID=A0A816ZDQ7_9BILA|nr:unnamed protein product [Rotaria magnacalcarata]